MNFDYYEVLEISRDADLREIKSSYRKLVHKYHPDKNPDNKEAEEKIKQINEAYATLSNPEKKQIYDRYGRDGLNQNGGGDFGDIFGDIFSSAFGDIFGQGRQKKQSRNRYKFGADYEVVLNLTFKESIFGCAKKIKTKYKKYCPDCSGNGAKDGKMQTCPECNGNGQIRVQRAIFQMSSPCHRCDGSGSISKDNCIKCHGLGYQEIDEEIELTIKAGIDNNNQMIFRGRGNEYKEGRGDLYISIGVKEHEYFIRHGNDIYLEVPIFFTTICLGGEIEIPTLTGKTSLKIPKNAKEGQKFIFNNEGVPDINSGKKGRLIAQITIEYPKKLNDTQSELLMKLHESFGENGEPHKGILDKIKSFFKG